MISELLARDHDYVRDRLVRRGYTPVDRGRRNRPMRAVDGYFLPTLFATEWLNFSQWPGYPQRPTKPWGSRRWAKGLLTTHRFDPARYFAVVLTPWRRWTLCIINYPVASRFDRKGRLEAVDLGLDRVRDLLQLLAQAVAEHGLATRRR